MGTVVKGIEAVLEEWRRERPDVDPRPIAVVGRLMRLSRFWSSEMKRLLADHGLEAGEFEVLCALRRAGPPYDLTAGHLLQASLVTSGTITNRIDRMEVKGLVKRTHDLKDRRAVRIRLTTSGLVLIEAVYPFHVAQAARLLGDLPTRDQEEFVRLLSTLLEPFERTFGA